MGEKKDSQLELGDENVGEGAEMWSNRAIKKRSPTEKRVLDMKCLSVDECL